MPVWLKVAAGVALGVVLIGMAGLQGASKKLGPLVQEHGTTYYSNDGPVSPPVICKPLSTILAAIDQVHAKYDHLAGDDLKVFEDRARDLKGLPPLNADQITLEGEAQQAGPVSQFSVNLNRNLPEFKWENPPPSNTEKGWTFKFEGLRPEAIPE